MNLEAIQKAKEAFEEEVYKHKGAFKYAYTTFDVIGETLTLSLVAVSIQTDTETGYKVCTPAITAAHEVLKQAGIEHNVYTHIDILDGSGKRIDIGPWMLDISIPIYPGPSETMREDVEVVCDSCDFNLTDEQIKAVVERCLREIDYTDYIEQISSIILDMYPDADKEYTPVILKEYGVDKVRCPKCGNKYILKDTSIYEISDEGAYDWAKPMITECNLVCTECGYEPPFDNHVDRVEILEEE